MFGHFADGMTFLDKQWASLSFYSERLGLEHTVMNNVQINSLVQSDTVTVPTLCLEDSLKEEAFRDSDDCW